jgi:hypothetical protein
MVTSPSDIWGYTQSAFELLKRLYEKFKRPEQPTYSANGKNSVVCVDQSVTHYHGPVVLQIAKDALPYYQNMTQLIRDEGVDSISFGNDASAVSIGVREKDIFDLPTTIEQTPVNFTCRIFDFNTITKAGKLSVLNSHEVPKGKYNFNTVGNQDPNTFIQALALGESTVEVVALKETLGNPLDPEVVKIIRFQIIAIRLPTAQLKS